MGRWTPFACAWALGACPAAAQGFEPAARPRIVVDDEVPGPPAPTGAPKRTGFVAGLSAGMAGPLGGTTVTPHLSEGLGVAGILGVSFDPLSILVFGQYVRSAIAYDPSIEGPVTENGADLWLAGAEVRASAGDEALLGWISFGLAIGGGEATAAGPNAERAIGYELTIGATPVFGLGAELPIGRHFAVGPVIRWYATNVSRVCRVDQGPSGEREADCTNDPANDQVAPDVLFFGLTGSFYPARTP